MRLFSMHIPKTGGRSFRRILENQYGADNVLHIPRAEIVKRHEEGTLGSIFSEDKSVLHCHFRFEEVVETIDLSTGRLITWLRDPVDRVISNHRFFIKRLQDDPSTQNDIHKINIHRKDEPLTEYAAMEENQNLLSKYLSGATLDDFFFIGFLERYEKDLKSLGDLLGWDIQNIPHENSSATFNSRFETPSEEERRLISEWNALDVALYEKAKNYYK